MGTDGVLASCEAGGSPVSVRAQLERQIVHLSLPLIFEAAFDDQEQVVDSLTDAQSGRDFEHARHPLSGNHARVRMFAQRRHVMAYEHATLLGSPLENRGVVGSRQADVLDAHEIDIGLPTK